MSNKLYRGERLKSRKEIQRLFGRNSASVVSYPLRLVYGETTTKQGNYPLQVGFSVPKRRFKKAVVRNRIKRQMRESFRLIKPALLEKIGSEDFPQYACMLLYVGKEEAPFRYINRKMEKVMQRFLQDITNG